MTTQSSPHKAQVRVENRMFARAEQAPPAHRAARAAALVLSRLVAVFLLFDGVARLVLFSPYVEGLVAMGYPQWLGPSIGSLLVACTVLYLATPTSVLGAVLLTGYLGGAAASQVRLEDPWFLFPVAMGVILWAHLFLREPRLRELLPLLRSPGQ
jgi:hypothetical protein